LGYYGFRLSGKHDLDRNITTDYGDAALRAGRPFLAVHINCDMETNFRRVGTPESLGSRTTKLTDARVLGELRSEFEML
jgi:hypothetical protein